MGCDIHAFIEYRRPNFGEYKQWRNFGKRFYLNRNYLMFGVLAGVRVNVTPIAEPRGIPEHIGSDTIDSFTYWVMADEDYHDQEGHIDRTRAEKWVADGSSEWFDEKHYRITSSDNHTPSWLTAKEYAKCIERVEKEDFEFGVSADYKAVLAVLQLFESEGYEARLVFWFDN